jgi:large-conductance mechanosensitive channel
MGDQVFQILEAEAKSNADEILLAEIRDILKNK